MKYLVKTRNWHCKKWVFNALNMTKKIGVQRGDSYTDGDGKFILETKKAWLAVMVWLYFMLLRRFSGGWTYLVRGNYFNGFSGDHGCKAIYWNYKPVESF